MPNRTLYAMLAVSLAAILVAPVFADVFVPAGPAYSQSEWISPTLAVFSNTVPGPWVPIGWTYTDVGFQPSTYNALTGWIEPGISQCRPCVVGPTDIPYGDQVTVLGFVPAVTISEDQTPVNITLQINWNGIPNTITLSSKTPVGTSVPPTIPAAQTGPYQYSYPVGGALSGASWNLYYGPYSALEAKFPGLVLPQSWQGYGEWFWYTFNPNVGNWEAFDSNGQVSPQPTYDITAMFEYGTTQIWFNHVAFNVDFLQLHKDLSYCTNQTVNDVITVTNVGLVPATGLDLAQTFPPIPKLNIYPTDYNLITASITSPLPPYFGGYVVTPTQDLSGASSVVWALTSAPWSLPGAFSSLLPGQTLTINIPVTIMDTSPTPPAIVGTIVFESVLSATQIPPWENPIGYGALVYPEQDATTFAPITGTSICPYEAPDGYFPLFCENILFDYHYGPITPTAAEVWLFNPYQQYVPTAPIIMTLDPLPCPLIAGETSVTLADVALVRNMMLGLAPYNWRADTNGNGIIDTQDLANYVAAAAGTS